MKFFRHTKCASKHTLKTHLNTDPRIKKIDDQKMKSKKRESRGRTYLKSEIDMILNTREVSLSGSVDLAELAPESVGNNLLLRCCNMIHVSGVFEGFLDVWCALPQNF